MDVAADFADLFEVKDALAKKDSLCQAFLGPIWSQRKSQKKSEVEKCLQHGMSQSTTPLTAVKPLRFP
jgi:hypothetical protein